MYVALFLTGLAIGTIGTLVGAGGGFLAVPILLLLFGWPHTAVVPTSLVMVTVSASVGTLLYFRQGKVDWRSGLLFALAGYPGTILGTFWAAGAAGGTFQILLAIVLLMAAAQLIFRPPMQERGLLSSEEVAAAGAPSLWWAARSITDATGNTYRFGFSPFKGLVASFTVAGLASALGIGGGVVLVPVLMLIGYPTHLATATSQFVVLLTSAGATSIHLVRSQFDPALAAALALGAACGAPLGARLAARISGRHLAMVLGVTLVLVGARLLL